MTQSNLVIIEGQEGAGKSTNTRALATAISGSARIDAEDVGEVNPWEMNDAYLRLLRKNIADLTRNFWDAGYPNVISGSVLTNVDEYRLFRDVLNTTANVWVVQLCASRATRDVRRIQRGKPTSEEWRDQVDLVDPKDTTFALATDPDFRFLRIVNDSHDVSESVDQVLRFAPELLGSDRTLGICR